jgi:hypothetical protein
MAVAPQNLPGKNHPRWWYNSEDGRAEDSSQWDYFGVTMLPGKQPRGHDRLATRLTAYQKTVDDNSIEARFRSGWTKPGSHNPRKR